MLQGIRQIDSLVFQDRTRHHGFMFVHHCPVCSTRSLQGYGSIVELRNTTDGPMGLVRCPQGHSAIVNFRTDEAKDALLVGADS